MFSPMQIYELNLNIKTNQNNYFCDKNKNLLFILLYLKIPLTLQNDILFFRYWQHQMGSHEIG